MDAVPLAIGPVDCRDLLSRVRIDGELTALAFGVVCVCDLLLCSGEAGGVAFDLLDGRGRTSGELGGANVFPNAGGVVGAGEED